MKKSMKRNTLWTDTPAGHVAYVKARAKAQALANELGFDYGLESNEMFKEFRVFMLPMRQNRSGHELRCEVVMCENLAVCQLGHGPQ